MIVRHPDCDTVGSIHADNVIADDNLNDADDATCTTLLDPLNHNAPPYRPCVDHDAPVIEPVFPFPDTSATDEPDPASNEYPATNPAGTGEPAGVVALATAEYPLTFPDRIHRHHPIAVTRRRRQPRVRRTTSPSAHPPARSSCTPPPDTAPPDTPSPPHCPSTPTTTHSPDSGSTAVADNIRRHRRRHGVRHRRRRHRRPPSSTRSGSPPHRPHAPGTDTSSSPTAPYR